MNCPVVEAIKDLKLGGYTTDESTQLAVVGGVEVVSDDVCYYVTLRKMELARFELTKPNIAECKAAYYRLYGDLVNKDYREVFDRLFEKTFHKRFVYMQLISLEEILDRIHNSVEKKISTAKTLNLTLPSINYYSDSDMLSKESESVEYAANQIIDYVNKLNVNVLLQSPVKAQFEHVVSFTGKLPVGTIDSLDANSTKDYLAGMKRLLQQEMEVCNYMKNLEAYHVYLINHLNDVYQHCTEILAQLDL